MFIGSSPSFFSELNESLCREGESYLVNGHKWWTSGAMDPRCRICIFMGKTDLSAAIHKQQSMVLVPMDAPGVEIVRPLSVFGYDDAPHGHAEMRFTVRKLALQGVLQSVERVSAAGFGGGGWGEVEGKVEKCGTQGLRNSSLCCCECALPKGATCRFLFYCERVTMSIRDWGFLMERPCKHLRHTCLLEHL
jgi:hypothetical protein